MNAWSSKPAGGSIEKAPLIYIVDDEPLLLELAEAVLRDQGFRFEKFTDPEPALAALEESNPKPVLLVTDFAMHSMNGLDFVSKCRERAPEIKTILVSGTVDEEFIRGAPVKVDRFLRKPYQPGDLIAAVRTVLGSGS